MIKLVYAELHAPGPRGTCGTGTPSAVRHGVSVAKVSNRFELSLVERGCQGNFCRKECCMNTRRSQGVASASQILGDGLESVFRRQLQWRCA